MNMKTDQESNRDQERPFIGRVTFANGTAFEYTDPIGFLKMIRMELPYHPTSGFRYETPISAPQVRKAVDGIFYDLYGEENLCTREDHQKVPAFGMAMNMI